MISAPDRWKCVSGISTSKLSQIDGLIIYILSPFQINGKRKDLFANRNRTEASQCRVIVFQLRCSKELLSDYALGDYENVYLAFTGGDKEDLVR